MLMPDSLLKRLVLCLAVSQLVGCHALCISTGPSDCGLATCGPNSCCGPADCGLGACGLGTHQSASAQCGCEEQGELSGDVVYRPVWPALPALPKLPMPACLARWHEHKHLPEGPDGVRFHPLPTRPMFEPKVQSAAAWFGPSCDLNQTQVDSLNSLGYGQMPSGAGWNTLQLSGTAASGQAAIADGPHAVGNPAGSGDLLPKPQKKHPESVLTPTVPP
ncbi:MAG: hypothetical protein KF752_13580 [Pirellulaceae bacterium]|nr:hypothetical protein [Pirellulaceae bacterium]